MADMSVTLEKVGDIYCRGSWMVVVMKLLTFQSGSRSQYY